MYTIEEKAKKFEEIQKWLWERALHGHPLASTVAAALIRELEIESPEGEDPDSA